MIRMIRMISVMIMNRGLQSFFLDRAHDHWSLIKIILTTMNMTNDHDPILGERYCGFNLRLLIAWDARLPCLGKHHRLQQYCSHPMKTWDCAYLFNLCIFCIFQVGQHYRLQYCHYAVRSTPTEKIVIHWILPKCLHPLSSWPTFKLNWKNLTKTSNKQKFSRLYCCLHMCTHVFFNTACHRERTSTINMQ